MTRPIAALLALLALSLPAFAVCGGSDLRPTLIATERTALDAALAKRPYPDGNHWRAVRGDAVVHLVGTMHIGDPRFDPVIDRLAPVVETADTLLLEMTAAERTELQRSMGVRPDMLLLDDATLPELLGDADWDRLAAAMRARGVPPFMASQFQPWYVSALLALPACLDLETLAATGLDARLEAIADRADVPTQALEPFDTAFRAFSEVPLDMQLAMIRASLAAPDANTDLFTTLVETYFEQAHAEGWLVTQVLAPRLSPLDAEAAETVNARIESVLLDARNRAWIPVIEDAAAAADGPVVAAFGAGHLAGEDGVLALMAGRGFALERLPF